VDNEHKQILDGLKKILIELHTTQQKLEDRLSQLDEKYVLIREWRIYHDIINRDLKNLGDKIREVEKQVKSINEKNQKQDIEHTKLATKIGTIIGLLGGLGGLTAIVLKLIE